MNTLEEIVKKYGDKAVDVEVYRYTQDKRYISGIHTDSIKSIEDGEYEDGEKVADWDLMTEEEYNNTVLANCSVSADFGEWYDDKDAKVLVIVLYNRLS